MRVATGSRSGSGGGVPPHAGQRAWWAHQPQRALRRGRQSPVSCADPQARVVAAVHAGRPGMVAGVVPAAVAAMRSAGARDLHAWVGPHVCGACYEVPEQMRAEASAVVPEAHAETSWGTPALDIGAGVHAQLVDAGVSVVDASRCTIEHEDLFSYRRQGRASGRLAGLVWVRP